MNNKLYKMLLQMVYAVLPVLLQANVKWRLKEKTVVFGSDIHLVCALPRNMPCCDQRLRQWNVGKDYKIITVNGKSVNRSKYREELNTIDYVSILTIMFLDEKDVNIPYECEYGFLTYRATLQLDMANFEYHPSNLLPVKPVVSGENVTLTVIFKKVYPIPVCSAVLAKKNITSYLDVTNKPHMMFYKSVITLHFKKKEDECKKLLRVNCRVGQQDIAVVETYINCTNVQEKLPEEDTTQSYWIVTAVVLLVFILCIFGLWLI